MFSRLFTVALLALPALVVLAEPIPAAAPAPAPTSPPEFRRDIFDDIASGANEVFGDITSGANGIYSFVTSEYSMRFS